MSAGKPIEGWSAKSRTNFVRRLLPMPTKNGARHPSPYKHSPSAYYYKHRPSSASLMVSKPDPKSHTSVEVGVSGIRKIFDSNNSTTRRVIWCFAILLSMTGFICELGDRLTLYFRYPINVDVQIKRNETIKFPSITLCPGQLKFDIRKTLGKHVRQRVDIAQESGINLSKVSTGRFGRIGTAVTKIFDTEYYHFPFDRINYSLHEIWDDFQISEDDVTVTTPCSISLDANSTTCSNHGFIPVSMTIIPMNTYWGTCLVMFTESFVAYRGPDTYIKIKITGGGRRPEKQSAFLGKGNQPQNNFLDNEPDEDGIGRRALHFFVHREGVFRRHQAFVLAEPILREYFTTVRFSIKEFHFLNTTDVPCINCKLEPIKCWNRCVDKILERKLDCSLPFMEGTRLPPCSTIYTSLKAYHDAESVYRTVNDSTCACPRNCYEKMFSLSPDVLYKIPRPDPSLGERRHLPHTTLTLYYPDNVNEVVVENYSYAFPALFSDISAYLSFFFGFSALTLLEVAETLAQRRRQAKRHA